MSLVDQIGDVGIGDIVSLTNIENGLRVVGYVHFKSPKKIKLSTKDVYNASKFQKLLSLAGLSKFPAYNSRKHKIDNSKKTYNLRNFDVYDILFSRADFT